MVKCSKQRYVMGAWILGLILSGLTVTEGAWSTAAEGNARNATLTGYDRLVRPNSTVNLQVGLHLLTINYLDIKHQTLSMTGWISAQWEDSRLKWSSPADYDTDQFFALESEIWKPDLFIDNALDAVSILNDEYLQFRIDKTGTVEWELPRIFVTHCSIEVPYFPFDTQKCIVELTSWAYAIDELQITPLYREVQTDEMSKDAEWDVVASKAETKTFSDKKPGGVVRIYSVIDFTITIKRNPKYYISSTILPVLSTSMLSVLVFILPVESGEKIGYILTVLLAEVVLLTLVQSNMPSSSERTSYLAVYLITTLIFCVTCVILTVIVIRIHSRSPNSRVPKWLNSFLHKFCIPVSCWRGCCCSRRNSPAKIRSTRGSTEHNTDDDNVRIEDHPVDHLCTWTEVAAILDWFFFVLMSVLMALFSIVLMFMLIIGGYVA